MSGIDKIYCHSKRDFDEFYDWCTKFDFLAKKQLQCSLLDYFYVDKDDYNTYFDGKDIFGVPITCFRQSQDTWLMKHCPVKWVRQYITHQYGGYFPLKKKDIELYIDCAK